MNLFLPNDVTECIIKLEKAGFEAACVGGSVRDMIMGRIPNDYDITTNALPEQIMKVFSHTIPTGIEHGTITVVTEKRNIEITTHRTEGDYTDHRRPDKVRFVRSIDADLCRRDFTINAICFNPSSGIYDPLGGTADIKSHIIKAIGNSEKRFSEDALRIMRAFRFSSELGFCIDEYTESSAVKLSGLLSDISAERIFGEFKKIILSKHPENSKNLFNSGALDFLGVGSVEYLQNLSALPEVFSLRLAVLSLKNGLNISSLLKKMKSDRQTQINTEIYCKMITRGLPTDKPALKVLLQTGGEKKTFDVLAFYRTEGQNTENAVLNLGEIINNGEPYRLSMLAVNGSDLINSGITGKHTGEELERLLGLVITDPGLNRKEILLSIVKNR